MTGAHGIRGEVRLKLFADDLSPYRSFDAGGRTLTPLSINAGPNGAIVRFAEIADRTAAEALRGTVLTVPRSALPPLPEGEYYHHDVIGLPVVTADGTALGVVATIENFGAGDVLEVETGEATTAMLPFRTPIAVLEAGRVVADPAFLV